MRKVVEFWRIWLVKLAFPQYWGLPTLVVWSQAAKETGYFKSNVYLRGNNLFGMQPNSRPYELENEFIGAEKSAKYANKWLSVWDYFKRQLQFKISYKTPEHYINETAISGYAADTDYASGWLKVYKSNKYMKLFNPLIYACALALAIWFFNKKR